MSSVVPTPSAGSAYRGPARWPLSVEAYHGLGEWGLIPEKTELLCGHVYPKLPKSPLHCLLMLRLPRWLQAWLPADCFLQSEQPLTFEDSEPEPDVSIVRGSMEGFRRSHPTTAELVEEVCVSSHDCDRDKLRACARAGVEEVRLVLGPERQIEQYRRPEESRYGERTVFAADATLTRTSLPGIRIPVAELFRGRESGGRALTSNAVPQGSRPPSDPIKSAELPDGPCLQGGRRNPTFGSGMGGRSRLRGRLELQRPPAPRTGIAPGKLSAER